ncbi:MAG: nucleotidyl transferase AbiEii/AbiGii toxin family protein [Bacteroidales bacterium]|nr:nucleotidyl transferase AbiEii/AbiGii toxin family protein [Bacteroidales bacterium]
MISENSYTTQWLDSRVREFEANSYDLAEKMVYAITLLEQLRFKGLDFIFKGGTSLILMSDHFHRFSKDIDILIPKKPANLTEIFDVVVATSPFIRWEPSERKNDEFQVSKEHYKFIYQQSKGSKYPEQPILLDIIFVENHYPITHTVAIKHALLDTAEPYAYVVVPTLDAITGDKLTAFAPATIGIPVGKGKDVEIAKQLFDLNMLFTRIESTEIVAQSFTQTAAMVTQYYQKPFTTNDIYRDIIDTAFTMALTGKYNPELYNEISTGVKALSQYLGKKTKFGYHTALTASAKIAYLAACLMTEHELIRYNWNTIKPQYLINRKIDHQKYYVLQKALKAGYPEAWFYWLQTSEILSSPKYISREKYS